MRLRISGWASLGLGWLLAASCVLPKADKIDEVSAGGGSAGSEVGGAAGTSGGTAGSDAGVGATGGVAGSGGSSGSDSSLGGAAGGGGTAGSDASTGGVAGSDASTGGTGGSDASVGGTGGIGGATGGTGGTGGSADAGCVLSDAGASLVGGHYPDSKTLNCTNTLALGACPSLGELLYGQDGNYLTNIPQYTTTTNTVLDGMTGLMWQRATDSQDWVFADIYCGSATTDGHADWRLPTTFELFSLLDLGRANPAIDTTAFPSTPWGWHWTSESSSTGKHWAVGFGGGAFDQITDTTTASVRCVRGTLPSGALSVTDGGLTVSDTRTSLVWQRAPELPNKTWLNALGYCEELCLAGRDDWRLPSGKELFTIWKPGVSSPAIDTSLFPSTSAANFWTSTPHTNPSSPNYMVVVNFAGAGAMGLSLGTISTAVRCVRGG